MTCVESVPTHMGSIPFWTPMRVTSGIQAIRYLREQLVMNEKDTCRENGCKVWIGVDIGGTKTAVLLSAKPPAILARIEFWETQGCQFDLEPAYVFDTSLAPWKACSYDLQ